MRMFGVVKVTKISSHRWIILTLKILYGVTSLLLNLKPNKKIPIIKINNINNLTSSLKTLQGLNKCKTMTPSA